MPILFKPNTEGRSKEQKEIINKFFFGKVKDTDYIAKIKQRITALNVREKGLKAFDLPDSVGSIMLEGFDADSLGDYYAIKCDGGIRTSCYEVTWAYLGEKRLDFYSVTFDMTGNAKRERLSSFFYSDITSVCVFDRQIAVMDKKAGAVLGTLKAMSVGVAGERIVMAINDDMEENARLLRAKITEKR